MPTMTRWTPARKLALLASYRDAPTQEARMQILRDNDLSPDEIVAWENRIAALGKTGISEKAIRLYRDLPRG